MEDLGRLDWDKFGIESAHLRIFSSYPEPAERRMLWSWLSFDDCVRLTTAALTAPRVGHPIAFGMSDNKLKPVDNRLSGHLGFYPEDSAEPFRTAVEAAKPPQDPKAPATRYLGGWFVDLGDPDDEAKRSARTEQTKMRAQQLKRVWCEGASSTSPRLIYSKRVRKMCIMQRQRPPSSVLSRSFAHALEPEGIV